MDRLNLLYHPTVDVAFDTGLFISLVLSTFDKPTIDLDIPLTVPVKLD
jgi:hypothetical protein